MQFSIVDGTNIFVLSMLLLISHFPSMQMLNYNQLIDIFIVAAKI